MPRSYSKDKVLRGKHLTLDSFLETYSLMHKAGAAGVGGMECAERVEREACGEHVENAVCVGSIENAERAENLGNSVEKMDKFSELIRLNYLEAYDSRHGRNL